MMSSSQNWKLCFCILLRASRCLCVVFVVDVCEWVGVCVFALFSSTLNTLREVLIVRYFVVSEQNKYRSVCWQVYSSFSTGSFTSSSYNTIHVIDVGMMTMRHRSSLVHICIQLYVFETHTVHSRHSLHKRMDRHRKDSHRHVHRYIRHRFDIHHGNSATMGFQYILDSTCILDE